QIEKKLLIVGDGSCGKTSLLGTFVYNQFLTSYEPTAFEETSVPVTVERNNRTYEAILNLWDTAGQEGFDRLRHLAYPDSDVILLCYSVDDPVSFKNVMEHWIDEIRMNVQNVPILLVGCKIDLKSTRFSNIISTAQGKALAKRIRTDGFSECSAKTGEGVQRVFKNAIQLALK
ncbi:Rho family protein ASCRUDRAFT_27426, partial [Ascoidea rubescens DSM 1968]